MHALYREVFYQRQAPGRRAKRHRRVGEALEVLFILHALRAGMHGTIEHPNRFAGAGLRQFLQEVCGELATRDMVRVFQLQIGGRVVASRIGSSGKRM